MSALSDLIEVLETHQMIHKLEFDFGKQEKCLIFEDEQSEGSAYFYFDYDGNFKSRVISN